MELVKLLLSLAAAATCYASPTPVLDLTAVGAPDSELLVRDGIKLAQSRGLEKRLEADFSLERTWNNEVLFGGSWNDNQAGASSSTKLSVTCIECYTRGTVAAKLVDKDIIHPALRLGFSGVEAYAFLGVAASVGQTFSVNLFTSESPIGIGIKGLDVGVVFFVDLVFSVSEHIDLTTGFQVQVPDDAYLEADIFRGDISDSFFEGLNSQSLPVTVTDGAATFKADLRLRVQAGAEESLNIFGIGAGAEIGIYVNIIEFVAVIDSTPTCPLETEVWWDLNVGAFAQLDVVVDYSTVGLVPTVSTTLLAASPLSSCWIETSSQTMSSSTIAATTTPSVATSDATSSVPSYTSSLSSSPASTGSSSSSLATTLPGTPTITSTPGITFSVPINSTTSDYSPSYSSLPSSNSSIPLITSTSATLISSAVVTTSLSFSASASTSTCTYVLTRCGVAGVVNCPATYQSEVTVTQTTTVYPAVSSSPPSKWPGVQVSSSGKAEVIVLQPLPTPVVATFAGPTSVHVNAHAESPAVTATTTATATAIVSKIHGAGYSVDSAAIAIASSSSSSVAAAVDSSVFPTLTPYPSAGASSGASAATGIAPGTTQGGNFSAPPTPVTADAGHFTAIGSVFGIYTGVATSMMIGLVMLIL